MRDRQRLELGPREYAEAKAAERRRHLAAVLEILRRARAERADWYLEALRVAAEAKARCGERARPPASSWPPDRDVWISEAGVLHVRARDVLRDPLPAAAS